MSKDPIWRGLRPNKAVRIFTTHGDISQEKFKEQQHDVGMVVKALHCVHARWTNLGDCIKIPQATMDDLKKNWKRNAIRGLIHVVDHWMKGDYDQTKLHPCWWSVVYVVADAIGGNNPSAARNIAENWKKYEKKDLSDVAKKGNSVNLTKLADVRDTIDVLMANYLSEVKFKWFEIGVLLGVPVSRLEGFIEGEVEDKLRAVIDAWLEMAEFDEFLPKPTMQVLIDAVADSVGGANKNLALKLTEFNPEEDDTSSSQEATPPPPVTSSSSAVTSSSPAESSSAAFPDKDDSVRKPHTPPPTTENGAENGVKNGVENRVENGASEETTEDDGNKKQRHEAKDRGAHTPELRFDNDSNQVTTVDIKPFSKASRDEGYYKMDSPKHGVALIINNKAFKRQGKREGTDRDEDNLVETFLYLGYRVEIRRDCKKKEMMNIFNDIDKFLSESNKKSSTSVAHDSFICCILSHGKKGRIVISADSVEVDLEDVERKVGNSKVLNSKPKLFFVQACQGDNYGTERLERVQADDSERGHFYFCYATVGGDKAFRNTVKGSWFVTELCKVLCSEAKSTSVVDMQLSLNRNVANNPLYEYEHVDGKTYVQQPTCSNQLYHHVHFFDGFEK